MLEKSRPFASNLILMQKDIMDKIEVFRDGAIGRVVVSNPSKLNAMSLSMWRALPSAMKSLDEDADIRIIVLEGDGSRSFVAGADISEFESLRTDPDAQATFNAAVDLAYKAPSLCRKPVIARIRGICMGGGLGLAAACDLRFCDDLARFCMPAGRLGLGYTTDGLRRFITCLGLQNTLDIFFSARMFDSAEALRMGFVSRVFPSDQMIEGVDAWLQQAVANAPLTLKAVKLSSQAALPGASDDLVLLADEAVTACFNSDDYREGSAAFMENRPPRFSGR
jgi:enoyl-CoA hydratase/carnithine racemase